MQNDAVSLNADIKVLEEEPPLTIPENLAAPALSPQSAHKIDQLKTTPQWSDWRWQMRNRIRNLAKFSVWFPALRERSEATEAAAKFPLAITPYYASLIRNCDESDPIFQMSVPQAQELWNPPFLRDDPLEEDHDMPVPGLVRRYPDRALLIVTTACAMYCRHCTRKRVTGVRETCISPARLKRSVEFLKKNPDIKEIIISGGDPFTLSNDKLEMILKALREVPHLDVIRFGTRTPVTMPMRITEELCAMIKKYHPIWINTHFNHPSEMTPEAAAACGRLVDAGVPVGNQSVLLRGINDDPDVMEVLLRGLIRMRVRPYYLFQCDLVPGVEHFRTPISRGIEIMEAMRGRLTGIAIPQYVVDTPHGGGKVPVLPNYIISQSPTHTVLRNFEGMMVSYPEPYAEERLAREFGPARKSATVWDLASGNSSKIQPENSDRQKRRRQYRA